MARKAATISPVDPEPTTADLCRDGCLSLDDAARYCGLTLDTFREHVLPHVAVVAFGRCKVVPKLELTRFLADRLAAGKGGPA